MAENKKKRRRGRPFVGAKPITVRVPPKLDACLTLAAKDGEGRPETIRRIVKEWAVAQGISPGE